MEMMRTAAFEPQQAPRDGDGDLFSLAGIVLPLVRAPNPPIFLQFVERRSNVRAMRADLGGIVPSQEPLELVSGLNNVFYMAIARSHHNLDLDSQDMFADYPDARRAAIRLERHGIILVGQLVQLTEAELLKLKFMSPEIIAEMKEQLWSVRLRFGMSVPFWNRRATDLPEVRL
jgi:hypothetical protein